MPCPHFKSLFFVFSDICDQGLQLEGQVEYTPQLLGDEEWEEKYIDGSGTKKYVVNIAQFFSVTRQANSTENIDTVQIFKKLRDWILEQDKQKNYPSFPNNCHIQEITATGGSIAGENENGMKCQMQIIINYYKESEDTLWLKN